MMDIDKIYGFLMIHNNDVIKKYYPLIQHEWNILQIHKDWHFAIGELLDQNKQVDIITVVDVLRKNNRLSDNTIYQTSAITNDAPYVRIDSLFSQISMDHTVQWINRFLKEFTDKINDVNFSPDDMIQLCDQTKQKLIDSYHSTEETNDLIIDNVIQRHNDAKNGIMHGVQLGWNGTFNKIILENVDVMVVGGRPAMGKTAWMVSLAKNLAFEQNKKCCIFSLEMSNEQMLRRFLACLTSIDSNKIKLGELNDYELSRIENIKNHPKFSNLTFIDGSQNMMDITRKVTELKNTDGLDVYMIDYLQKVIPSKTDSRYAEVTRISNDIKRLTMGVKIPCIALAQLSRESAKTGKRPSLPDLKESGEIEQDASVVGFLHRPEYYGEMSDQNGNSTEGKGEFIIAKNRDGETGIVPMKIELPTSTWVDDDTPEFKNFNDTPVGSIYHDEKPF